MSESTNPVSIAKSVLTPGFIIKTLLGFFVMNLLLDLTGLSEYFYSPLATLKAKFGKS